MARAWTHEELCTLRKMLREGKSHAVMATALRRTLSAVRTACWHEGKPRRDARRRIDAEVQRRVAALTGDSREPAAGDC